MAVFRAPAFDNRSDRSDWRIRNSRTFHYRGEGLEEVQKRRGKRKKRIFRMIVYWIVRDNIFYEKKKERSITNGLMEKEEKEEGK